MHVFFEGANEGDAVDDDGDGRDEVQTEMVSMDLTGNSSMGPVIVRLNPNRPSRGAILETVNTLPGRLDLPPFAPTGSADSFFDVFVEVELPDGTVLQAAAPKRMSSRISHKPPATGEFYEGLDSVELLFPDGTPSGFYLGATRHVPRPVVEVDVFELTRATIELISPDGSTEIITGTFAVNDGFVDLTSRSVIELSC